MAKCELLVTQVHYELRALQTHAANIQTAMASPADASASALGCVQELEISLLSAERDLVVMQPEWRTVKGKESQLLEIGKSFGGQVAVLGAKLRGAQTELSDLNIVM